MATNVTIDVMGSRPLAAEGGNGPRGRAPSGADVNSRDNSRTTIPDWLVSLGEKRREATRRGYILAQQKPHSMLIAARARN